MNQATRIFFGLLLTLICSQGLVFSEEPSAKIDPGHEDHFSEKHPELPNFDPIPSLKIRGFADFTFNASHQDSEYESEFELGGLSLLITSQINPRLRFLGELSYYRDIYYLDRNHPGYPNSAAFEFQRFVLNYNFSDGLNIAAGRFHSALGYWNHTYHHGTWLQSSIFRPEIYRFEFQGGILPEHSVGVEFFGFKVVQPFDLRYHLGVSNGRGRKLWVVQNFSDENRSKALTVFLSLQPHFVEGLQFGGTFYLDTIPPDTTDLDANGNVIHPNPVDERIAGAHLIYINESFEWLSEFFHLYHAERLTGLDFETQGAYVQGNVKTLAHTAYYRYDFIDFPDGDPVYWSFHRDISKHTVGLRWDISSWNALKFELSRSKRKDREPEESVLVNTSFTF